MYGERGDNEWERKTNQRVLETVVFGLYTAPGGLLACTSIDPAYL